GRGAAGGGGRDARARAAARRAGALRRRADPRPLARDRRSGRRRAAALDRRARRARIRRRCGFGRRLGAPMTLTFARPELLLLLVLLPAGWLLARSRALAGVLSVRAALADELTRGRPGAALAAALPRLLRAGSLASVAVVLAGPTVVRRGQIVERQ